MESVEAEGRSIDDAIEHALQRLGVTRDKVEIEILSNTPRGLFGLGGRKATVRATLRRPLPLANTAAPASPDTPPAHAAPGRRASADRAAPPAPARSAACAPAPRRADGRRSDVLRAPDAPADRETLERARGVLSEILRLSGSEGRVEVVDGPPEARLVIAGDSSGVLIGRRGQTLDALEYVVNRIITRGEEPSARLIVDVHDYRLRRQQVLEEIARRAAARARRRSKPVTLDPMSPRDRRIVHMVLRQDPTLTTRSAGTGFYRKVIIIPAGGRRPSPPRPAEQP